MNARLIVKRYDARPGCPAFISICVQDVRALIQGVIWLGEKPSIGSFTVHMMNPAFGPYGNAMGLMSKQEAESFLQMVIGPIGYRHQSLQVAA